MPTYYTEKHHAGFAAFKASNDYQIFKIEYIAAINIIIDFYSNHAFNQSDKQNVERGLNNFKNRLFKEWDVADDAEPKEILHILFSTKKNMEAIAQTLKREEDQKPFTPNEIEKRRLAIYNLAASEGPSAETELSVCASGTARNLADTALMLTVGADLFENLQIQRTIIFQKIVSDYVLTHQREIRNRWEGYQHDTNLMNVFMNAFSQQGGYEQVTESYASTSLVNSKDRTKINLLLKQAVTPGRITEELAAEYLRKIRERITYHEDGTINHPSAVAAIDSLSVYGEPPFESVFHVNEKYQIIDVTTDTTPIQVFMARYFDTENKKRKAGSTTFTLMQEWETATSINESVSHDGEKKCSGRPVTYSGLS